VRLGRRLRTSARQARAGYGGGLAGPLLARLGFAPAHADTEAETEPAVASSAWDDQAADAYDDRQLAALRDELATELDRLSRPRNDEAPGP
jgi:hypothetical protein